MKCPHCLADLKYRDRRYSSEKCPQCQRPFALEPRHNILKMSDLRLRGLAEYLSEEGKYRYTVAQLGHAAVRRNGMVQHALRNNAAVGRAVQNNAAVWHAVWDVGKAAKVIFVIMFVVAPFFLFPESFRIFFWITLAIEVLAVGIGTARGWKKYGIEGSISIVSAISRYTTEIITHFFIPFAIAVFAAASILIRETYEIYYINYEQIALFLSFSPIFGMIMLIFALFSTTERIATFFLTSFIISIVMFWLFVWLIILSLHFIIFVLFMFLVALFFLFAVGLTIEQASDSFRTSFRWSPSPLDEFLPVPERFEEQFVAPWEGIHGVLPGRVTAQEMTALRQFQLPPSQVRAVLASPVADVLDCLRANGLPQRLGLALINPDQPAGADEAIIALLRSRPQLPLLLVHDASAPGCLLPALLPAKWGLAPNHRIVDLGLRPRHVQQLRLPWKREVTLRALLDLNRELYRTRREREAELRKSLNLFRRRERRPNGLALTPEECEWLRRGYVTSALFISPARLVTVVTQAVERLAQAQHAEQEAQAQARAVGFMTWPS